MAGVVMAACVMNAQAADNGIDTVWGRVCLAPMTPQSVTTPENGKFQFQAGEAPHTSYSVQIDSGNAVTQSSTTIHWFSNLDVGRSHNVLIHGDGKKVAKFSFSFEEFGFKKKERKDLCLFQNDLYLTWQLWPVKRTDSWCPCWSNEK